MYSQRIQTTTGNQSSQGSTAVMLSSDSFNQNTDLVDKRAKSKTVILFYADWCGHCQRVKPEFYKLSEMALSGKLGNDVTVAMVNTDENPDLMNMINSSDMSEYEVKGFPTIVSYKDGKYFSTYAPGASEEEKKNFRTATDLIDYIKTIGIGPIVYKA
jgi:thiol-disulfide isomerase/thioredoxin